MLTAKSDTNPIKSRVLHPCQYCEKQCYGSQCKECHLKMIAEREGECIDCSSVFYALRKDGSKRLRCQACQQTYNDKYIAKCPECNLEFHSKSKDGRCFETCFSCYKKKFIACRTCEKDTLPDFFPLCKDCHFADRESRMKNCANINCTRTTLYRLCKQCNDANRTLSDRYVLSRCQERGCGVRIRGDHKFCEDHL